MAYLTAEWNAVTAVKFYSVVNTCTHAVATSVSSTAHPRRSTYQRLQIHIFSEKLWSDWWMWSIIWLYFSHNDQRFHFFQMWMWRLGFPLPLPRQTNGPPNVQVTQHLCWCLKLVHLKQVDVMEQTMLILTMMIKIQTIRWAEGSSVWLAVISHFTTAFTATSYKKGHTVTEQWELCTPTTQQSKRWDWFHSIFISVLYLVHQAGMGRE